MKAPPTPDTRGFAASVLFAAPRADQLALSTIVLNAPSPSYPNMRWTLLSCGSVQSALRLLEKKTLPVVMCDCDLGQEAWIELLRRLDSPQAPSLIVTSRLADDRLWAEALNLGAYDVLAKPFDAAEVVRTLSFAWWHWANRNGLALASANDPPRAAGVSGVAPATRLAAQARPA